MREDTKPRRTQLGRTRDRRVRSAESRWQPNWIIRSSRRPIRGHICTPQPLRDKEIEASTIPCHAAIDGESPISPSHVNQQVSFRFVWCIDFYVILRAFNAQLRWGHYRRLRAMVQAMIHGRFWDSNLAEKSSGAAKPFQ